MSRVTAAIPVKPFSEAKKRLSDVFDADGRRNLGERLALHTIETVSRADVSVLVLSADDGVTEWARANGVEVLLDEGSNLDRAASVARDHLLALGRGWMVVHADLPVLGVQDVTTAAQRIEAGATVIAPSSDGGTSMIGSPRSVRFAYGPGSFHRHLARVASMDPEVLVSSGWALDLDTPADLVAVTRHPSGAWLGAG